VVWIIWLRMETRGRVPLWWAIRFRKTRVMSLPSEQLPASEARCTREWISYLVSVRHPQEGSGLWYIKRHLVVSPLNQFCSAAGVIPWVDVPIAGPSLFYFLSVPSADVAVHYSSKISRHEGRVIAQAVSRRLPTAAARVRGRVRSWGMCGGQSGTGTGFLRVLRFPLPILIPPVAPPIAGTIGQ
jgi:hypothetical protein